MRCDPSTLTWLTSRNTTKTRARVLGGLPSRLDARRLDALVLWALLPYDVRILTHLIERLGVQFRVGQVPSLLKQGFPKRHKLCESTARFEQFDKIHQVG